MNRTLKIKAAVIVAVILACVYGIIGLPKSPAEVANNFHKNIRLGLDLRGGSQLVMQVQIQDAFKAEADAAIQRLQDDMQKAGIDVPAGNIGRNDPQTIADANKIEIDVHGVPPTKAGDFRQLVNKNYGQTWVLTAVNSTDYRMTMRPTEALKLRTDTITQTKNTIEKKINGLGLAEATVQQRGSDNNPEILVQMPGVDDPARVKEILKTTAMLELDEVKDGPFSSREEALAKHGGVLPLNTQADSGGGARGAGRRMVPVDPHSRDHWSRPSRRARSAGRDGSLGDELRSDAGRGEAV